MIQFDINWPACCIFDRDWKRHVGVKLKMLYFMLLNRHRLGSPVQLVSTGQ